MTTPVAMNLIRLFLFSLFLTPQAAAVEAAEWLVVGWRGGVLPACFSSAANFRWRICVFVRKINISYLEQIESAPANDA